METRYLSSAIQADIGQTMVFLGGPRQVGKTTLATLLGKANYNNSQYLNWDNRQHRRDILDGRFHADADLIIFDEIHKYKSWKNLIKGVYDTHKQDFRILVTGSARLDMYRRGGDSLMGRYHYYRLHPFSVAEAVRALPPPKNVPVPFQELTFPAPSHATFQAFQDLLRFGGFPEPFLAKNDRTLRRFHRGRLERLVMEDIRDTEGIRDLTSLDIMAEMLPGKVGSLFSLNSLSTDLQVTHATLSRWADVLERFYYHYRIYPFTAKTIRSLRKEPKLYLWDWSQVSSTAPRLENMVASHLLKMVHFLEDYDGHKAQLYFLRDTDGREADFLVTVDNKPWFVVEVKESVQELSSPLLYFTEKLRIPWSYQLVSTPGVDFIRKGVRVMSAHHFLSGLV